MEVVANNTKPLAHYIQSVQVPCFLAPKQQRVFVIQILRLQLAKKYLLQPIALLLPDQDLPMINAK
jgi:hypothetical protein